MTVIEPDDIILRVIRENDSVLSRTFSKGRVNTDISFQKIGANIQGLELLSRVEQNQILTAKYITAQSIVFHLSPTILSEHALNISKIVNLGISNSPIFRTWSIKKYQENEVESQNVPTLFFDKY